MDHWNYENEILERVFFEPKAIQIYSLSIVQSIQKIILWIASLWFLIQIDSRRKTSKIWAMLRRIFMHHWIPEWKILRVSVAEWKNVLFEKN